MVIWVKSGWKFIKTYKMDVKMNNIVSIIIPRLQGRRHEYLQQAVESVDRQTYPNIELLIVESDKSEAENIAIGLRKSCGDIIHILHDDDWLPENSVELAVIYMKHYDFIHGNAMQTNGQLYTPPKNITIQSELKRTGLHNATMYYRKKCFDIPYLWEVDFHVRNLAKGWKLGYCPNILAFYRLHKNQLGRNPERRKYKQELRNQLIKDYGLR
jgi:glycosyltransferase involved in cell wall biosynthesis